MCAPILLLQCCTEKYATSYNMLLPSSEMSHLLHFCQDGFIVEAAGGHKFHDVDLSDDWADFDEKSGNSVSVMDLQWRFSVRR
jgi:Eukaryotic protein of unknown function (DUF866)